LLLFLLWLLMDEPACIAVITTFSCCKYIAHAMLKATFVSIRAIPILLEICTNLF
jgi:hypothetical protein